MNYISTRGGIEPIPFKETVLMGLAEDGGLILPEVIPKVEEDRLNSWKDLSYQDLAIEVISLFADDIPLDVLRGLVYRAYSSFTHREVCPVVKKGRVWILELFHGPTLAFKDVALQFLGNLFEYLLAEQGLKMNILGATSGDTGSAAIYGVRGRKNINIFILHPRGRVSPIQALQMTTVTEANIFNLAIEGTFDDCQSIVKAIFADLDFKKRFFLGAVNSINWARVLAQVVYYIWAYLRVSEAEKVEQLRFSVPTGNFGDIFAGYIARKMLGNRIERLILATNENDILTRFVNYGDYSLGKVTPTISPSMDIQIASNFERYLFYLCEEDALRVKKIMLHFTKEGKIIFSPEEIAKVKRDFLSLSVNQQDTLAMIDEFFRETGYILDPHTAVGVRAGLEFLDDCPLICLATAHPAKFPDAVIRAIGQKPECPAALQGLEKRQQRFKILPAEVEKVKEYVAKHALK